MQGGYNFGPPDGRYNPQMGYYGAQPPLPPQGFFVPRPNFQGWPQPPPNFGSSWNQYPPFPGMQPPVGPQPVPYPNFNAPPVGHPRGGQFESPPCDKDDRQLPQRNQPDLGHGTRQGDLQQYHGEPSQFNNQQGTFYSEPPDA